MVDRKHELFAGIHGNVVELGPGTGPNFRYYPSTVVWTGVEPNVHLHRFLPRPRPSAIQITSDSIDSSSADAVVSTLVLCSVVRPADVLAEVVRILKPGGRFYFLEHVAAPEGERMRTVQKKIQPLWRFIGDGCHPCRDTLEEIRQAGFREVDVEHFQLPLGPLSPHVSGVAVK